MDFAKKEYQKQLLIDYYNRHQIKRVNRFPREVQYLYNNAKGWQKFEVVIAPREYLSVDLEISSQVSTKAIIKMMEAPL
jgi:hypothetical protein